MNESRRRLPKYRLHKRSGHALVVLNDREIYLGKHGTPESLERYSREIAQWLQQGEVGGSRPQDLVSVAEVMAAYIKYAKGYYLKDGKPTREYEIIVEICRIVQPLYSGERASNFGPMALKTVRQVMVDMDWSRRHINKQIDRIKRMFRWAAEEEIVNASIPQALSMVKGLRKGRTVARETDPILPVEDDVMKATLQHMPNIVADMVRFQRLTGSRPAEVCILRPCDLDRTDDTWTYRPETHKTEHHGRDRIIDVGPRTQGIILRYLARDAQEYCFRPCDSELKRRAAQHAKRRTPKAQGNRPGKNCKRNPKRRPGSRYETASYRRAIHRACDKAFPHPVLGNSKRKSMTDEQVRELQQWQSDHRWSPNRLRHAKATEVRSEFGLEAAQIVLGHSTADVTQIYAERDAAKGREVARKTG